MGDILALASVVAGGYAVHGLLLGRLRKTRQKVERLSEFEQNAWKAFMWRREHYSALYGMPFVDKRNMDTNGGGKPGGGNGEDEGRDYGDEDGRARRAE